MKLKNFASESPIPFTLSLIPNLIGNPVFQKIPYFFQKKYIIDWFPTFAGMR